MLVVVRIGKMPLDQRPLEDQLLCPTRELSKKVRQQPNGFLITKLQCISYFLVEQLPLNVQKARKLPNSWVMIAMVKMTSD